MAWPSLIARSNLSGRWRYLHPVAHGNVDPAIHLFWSGVGRALASPLILRGYGKTRLVLPGIPCVFFDAPDLGDACRVGRLACFGGMGFTATRAHDFMDSGSPKVHGEDASASRVTSSCPSLIESAMMPPSAPLPNSSAPRIGD